jgi:hypothetical protein
VQESPSRRIPHSFQIANTYSINWGGHFSTAVVLNTSCFKDRADINSEKIAMFVVHKESFTQNSIKQLHINSARKGSQVNSYLLLCAQHSYCWEEATLWDIDLSCTHNLAISCEENLQTDQKHKHTAIPLLYIICTKYMRWKHNDQHISTLMKLSILFTRL